MAIVLLLWSLAGTAAAQDVELPPKTKEPFIGRVVIDGNRSFSDRDLERQMTTSEAPFFAIFKRPRLDRDALRRDIAALEALYRTNGFLDAKVSLVSLEPVEDGAFVDVIIRIEEGEPTRVETVSFEGAGPVPEERLLKRLRLTPGVPFNPTLINADIYAMKGEYFEKGHLAVEIVDSIAVEARLVRIFYRVEPGPVVSIEDIEIKGNRLTKNYIIERELAFRKGETFRLSRAIETQRNLFETGLFTEAEIIPENLDDSTRTVHVLVRVRERKSAYFEAGFGVGNILGSRTTGEWGDRNLFGHGLRVRLKGEYSFELFKGGVVNFNELDPRVKYYRYDVEFGQRHVLGSRFLLGINGFLEKDATVEPIIIRTRGAAIGGVRHLSPRADLVLRLSDERIEREVPDGGDEESHTRLASSTVSHDTRDFVLDPRKGAYRDIRAELAGGPLGGDNDFYTLNGTMQRYLPTRGRSVFAVRLRAAFADAYGDSEDLGVPVENRYFTGGGNSVRGYRENSLGPRAFAEEGSGELTETVVGGRFLLLGNAEIRFPVPFFSRYRFSASAFVDCGNVWPSLRSVDLKDFRLRAGREEVNDQDFRYSAGVGLRYNTPIGPIRLDYGMPLKKDESDRFGRFHLSLGQIF